MGYIWIAKSNHLEMISSSPILLFLEKMAARSDGSMSELNRQQSLNYLFPWRQRDYCWHGTCWWGRGLELAPGAGGARLGRAGLGRSPRAVLRALLQHRRGNSASPTLTNYRASILTIWGISMLRKQIRNSIPELFLNAVINFRVLSHKTNSA